MESMRAQDASREARIKPLEGDGARGAGAAMAGALRAASDGLALGVFERFPYGIIVARANGTVVAYNAAAGALLGDLAAGLDAAEEGLLCELIGCRRAGEPLEHVCLLERAIASDGALPEVRVDLPSGGGAPALWITAAPLDRERQWALVELRPGQANDRRRRTVPHWTRGPQLHIFTLGRTRVESAEGPIGGRWLENRAGQVLKYLVAERDRVVYADEIVETLWADAGIRNLPGLRYFIHALRDQLEPDRPRRGHSSFVQRAGGGYMLDRTRVRVDADDFEREVTTGLAALAEGRETRALHHLERGIALYGGDFLADEPYAEWAIAERDRLRNLAGEALRALADLRRRADDLQGATADLERLTELEPYDVDVHRELIAVALQRGRRTEAVRRYNALRHRMLVTFGEDLDFTLSDLAAA